MGSGAAGSWRLWRQPVLHRLSSFGISWGQGVMDSVCLRDSGHPRASSLSTRELCAMGIAGASRQAVLTAGYSVAAFGWHAWFSEPLCRGTRWRPLAGTPGFQSLPAPLPSSSQL